MAKTLGIRQLKGKKHRLLENLPPEIARSFGLLVEGLIMIVWGQSGQGKSNFLMQFLKALVAYGQVLYVSLEEGFERSMYEKVVAHLNEADHGSKVLFANHEMTLEKLKERLHKKKSPKWIIIDSVQYWGINYVQYKQLKEEFPNKGFIFISHASGKNPDGKSADKIRYDAGVKVRVEGFVGFPVSRYGGNKPYIVWEEGAVRYWGRKKVNQFKKN